LVVNRVNGVRSRSTLPTCGSLRGEPCRTLQAEGNQVQASGLTGSSVSTPSHRHGAARGRSTGRK